MPPLSSPAAGQLGCLSFSHPRLSRQLVESLPDATPHWRAGVDWWAKQLMEAMGSVDTSSSSTESFQPLLHEKKPRRRIKLEVQCCGMVAEILGSEVGGYDIDVLGVADSKPAAQRWIQANWFDKPELRHVFESNTAFFGPQGGGTCRKCGKWCRRAWETPDIMSGGFPCPAFSDQRQKNGDTPSTGPVDGHPTFHMAVTEFILYLDAREPLSF